MSKTTYGSQRKRSRLSVPLMTLAILVLGLIGGALILQAGGVIQIPLLSKTDAGQEAPDYSGMVLLPRSTRLIKAYSAVSRDDILDRNAKLAFVPMRPQQVTDDMLTDKDLGQIIGRVLKQTKPAGYVFQKSDFYPPGTRPGPTAGVPAGKRAMRLKASDVPGLHGLNQFDRFDIVATISVELEDEPVRNTHRGGQLDVDGPYSELAENAPEPVQPAVRVKKKRAEVETIVSNGIVVLPVERREQLGTTSSLLRGTAVTTTPVEEIIIAVDPEEVAALNLALATEAQLQVAMRSGQVMGEDFDEGEIPPIEVVVDEQTVPNPDGEGSTKHVKVVEVIRGGQKHLMAVPTDKEKDAEKAPEESSGG